MAPSDGSPLIVQAPSDVLLNGVFQKPPFSEDPVSVVSLFNLTLVGYPEGPSKSVVLVFQDVAYKFD